MPKVSATYLQEKKEHIIASAYTIALRKPIGSITMQNIIDESGLSQGGIYRFYKNIDEIIADIIQKIRNDINFIHQVDVIFQRYEEQPHIILDKVFNLLSDYMEEHLHDYCKIDFEISQLAMQDPHRMKKLMNVMKEEGSFEHLTNCTISYFNRKSQEGKLHLRISVEQLVSFMAASFNGIQSECICAACYRPHQKELSESFQPRMMLHTLKVSILYLLGEHNEEVS